MNIQKTVKRVGVVEDFVVGWLSAPLTGLLDKERDLMDTILTRDKQNQGSGMGQSIKCSLCKHEALSSVLRTHV